MLGVGVHKSVCGSENSEMWQCCLHDKSLWRVPVTLIFSKFEKTISSLLPPEFISSSSHFNHVEEVKLLSYYYSFNKLCTKKGPTYLFLLDVKLRFQRNLLEVKNAKWWLYFFNFVSNQARSFDK